MIVLVILSSSMVRSGYVNARNGSVFATGRNSSYWSVNAYPSSRSASFYLSFNTTDVYPASHSNYVDGFSA